MLFDVFDRTDMGSARRSDPHFTYLNRTARPEFSAVRVLLEKWFARYPPTEQDALRAAFRSADDAQHVAACFELFLHELLLTLGCRVAIHPEVAGVTTRPDFLVTDADGRSFILEAVVCTDQDRGETAEAARINAAYDALDSVDSPNFSLAVEMVSAGPAQVSGRRLREFARRFLAPLDPDRIAAMMRDGRDWDDVPSAHFSENSWSIVIRPIPRSPERRGQAGGTLGITAPGEAQWIQPAAALRRSILRKAARYGNALDLPFVIAVDEVSSWVRSEHEMEALFGNEVIKIQVGSREPRLDRQLNGVWTSPQRPRYARVSGVLFVRRLLAWTVATAQSLLYHNPWARISYESVLTRLPRRVPEESGMLSVVDGQQAGTILGLPEGWPFQARPVDVTEIDLEAEPPGGV